MYFFYFFWFFWFFFIFFDFLDLFFIFFDFFGFFFDFFCFFWFFLIFLIFFWFFIRNFLSGDTDAGKVTLLSSVQKSPRFLCNLLLVPFCFYRAYFWHPLFFIGGIDGCIFFYMDMIWRLFLCIIFFLYGHGVMFFNDPCELAPGNVVVVHARQGVFPWEELLECFNGFWKTRVLTIPDVE